MAGPKPMRTEFGIRQRLESCVALSSSLSQSFKGMKETAEIIGKDLDLSQTIDEYNAEVLRNPASQQSRFVAIPLPTKPNQEGTWLGNKKKSNKQCFWMLENETVCGKTFAKNDSLRRHIEAEHKGIKPHACRYGH